MESSPARSTYDHRLRAEVVRSRSVALALDLGVPRSTASTWLSRGAPANVVTLPAADETDDVFVLRVHIRRLERRVRILATVVMLLRLARRLDRPATDSDHVDAATKTAVLRAVARAGATMPQRSALAILGVSPGRLRAWRSRAAQCRLEDASTCPRSRPTRLTLPDIRAMRDLVLSEAHRAFSVRALALHAARVGAVYASATTWARTIRARGWRRPTRRVHPRPSHIGLRTTRPNEAWHVDVTVVKLVDGTRVFVQAVMDNFSRKILAHRVSSRLDPAATATLLREAAVYLGPHEDRDVSTDVVCDGGVENLNGEVDAVLPHLGIRRLVALIDVDYSNSLVEALWRSLKHRWLFLHALTSIEVVRDLVGRYVELHNAEMPHAAFRGRTPDEVFHERGDGIEDELVRRHRDARARRLEENRRVHCDGCREADTAAGCQPAQRADSPMIPLLSHLRQERVDR